MTPSSIRNIQLSIAENCYVISVEDKRAIVTAAAGSSIWLLPTRKPCTL